MSTADASGHVMVVPRAGWSGLPLWICADPNEFESTLGVLTVLDDSEGEVGGAVHDARWRDWLRWSNILQFVASPQYGMVMPRRMAAIWTIRSLGEFIAQPVPLEGVGTGRTDIEFAMTPEWELVQKYTDPVVAELVTALARKDVAVPEPGLEVGPVDSVWQVELAWEDDQVAVVVDTDVERDNWLREHGWTVRTVDRDSDIDAAVGDIAARVTGGTR